MSQKEDLRCAAKEIYEENSKRVSNCFALEGLKNIGVIYTPEDSPIWVMEIATLLKQMVRKKYPETETEIVITKPLFKRYFYAYEYLKSVYQEISAKSVKDKNHEKLLLCGTNVAATMMCLHSEAGKGLSPMLFLDVNAFYRCKASALADAAEKLGLSAPVVEMFEPYRCKKYVRAEYLVVYASGYDSWQDLIHAWYGVKQEYDYPPRIIYVDDLRRWTSVEYGETIFKKFSKLLRRMSIKKPEIIFIPSVSPQLVLDVIESKQSIMFIPQLKTYLCDKMGAENLTFDICEKEFEEYWNLAGPIARQFFCQELKEFMENWSEDRKQKFNRLLRTRKFKDWNLRFYWWNYKIRLNSFCRQVFLSEFMMYR